MTTENQEAVLIPASTIISTLLSDDGSSTDIRSLISTSHSTITTQSTRLDSQLFNSLPTTLSSHSSLQESLSTLSNLHSLLSSFSTSLSSASSQISVLQQRSSLIDKRLKARERLERRLNDLLNNIALQPEVVKIIFDTKPLPGKDGKDEINHKWLMAIDKLDKVLQATSDLSTVQSLKKGKDREVDALSEARNVAEACRIIASTKLLPHLLSLLSPLRTSVTSNHLILQSIILLKHSHPFYSFLARHSPRVAIDFQKGYASNARLYFETGFRRYRRSLDKLMKKGLGKWELEEKGGIGEVGNVGLNMFSKSNPQSSNPSPKPGASRPSINTSVSERPSSADSPSSSSETDSWIPDVKRLENSRLEDGPGIVLAYQADESGFRATTEALFRSLALVFVDNACSEYVFIVRFFENAILNPNSDSKELNGTASSKSKKKEAVREEEENLDGEEDDDDDEEDEEAMNPVALNQREIKAGSSRPAADEMWKQVMEPVLGHWNSFTKSLLTPSPSLLSLLTMLTLNDKLIALADLRGCSSILQSPLLGFKLQAWPLVQKAFENHIDSLKRVNGGSSEVEGGALKAFSSGWGMGGMMRAALDATGAGGLGLGADDLKEEHVKIICSRYARIYSSVTLLSDGQEDGMLSNSLNRLRMEIEKFVSFQSSKRSSNASAFARSLYGVIIKGLENGPAPTVNPRIQSELSLFNELERATT